MRVLWQGKNAYKRHYQPDFLKGSTDNFRKDTIYYEPRLKAKFETDPEFSQRCAQVDLQEDEADEKC